MQYPIIADIIDNIKIFLLKFNITAGISILIRIRNLKLNLNIISECIKIFCQLHRHLIKEIINV